MRNSKILVAEAVGTFILMLGGPGTAVFAAEHVGVLGVSLGFGFALLVAAYAIGPVSGCHINPAVTVGLALAKKIDHAKVPVYVVGQVLGAVAGGFAIWVVRHGAYDSFDANPGNFATNLWGRDAGFFNFGAMAATEIVLTAVLVLVVLTTTRKGFPPAAIGVAVGLALTLIHLVSIPIDNTSVNPVRSLGMAVFAGGDAIEQLWAFVVFPLIGAVLGVLVWLAIDDASLEDTMLDDGRLVDVRDRAMSAAGAAAPAQAVSAGVGGDAAPSFATGPAVGDGPYGPGSHGLLADPRQIPEGFPIKGNADSMLYHRPDSRNYGATGAEVYFDSADRAEAAGFGLAPTHPKD